MTKPIINEITISFDKPKSMPIVEKVHAYFLTFSFVLLFLGNNLFDKKIIALFLIIQIALLAVYRSVEFFTNFWRFSGLLALLAWCAYSVTWSQFPNATMDGVVFLSIVMFAGLSGGYVASNINWHKAIRNAVLIVLSLNLMYVLAFYGAANSEIGLRSFYGTKNGLGLVAAICFYVLYFYRPKKIADYAFLFFALALLLLSQSKTSLYLVVLTISLMALKDFLFRRDEIKFPDDSYLIFSVFTWFFFFMVIFAFFIFQDAVLNYIFYNLTDEMFTGRGIIWIEMLRQAESKISQGLGFNAVWGMERLNQINLTSLYMNQPLWVEKLVASDGGYVDIVVAIGTIGLVVFLFSVVQIFLNILLSKSINILLSIFIFILFHNLTETTFMMGFNINWFIFLFFAGIAMAERINFVKLQNG